MSECLFQFALKVALRRDKFFQLPRPLTFRFDFNFELGCRLFQTRVLFFNGHANFFHDFKFMSPLTTEF